MLLEQRSVVYCQIAFRCRYVEHAIQSWHISMPAVLTALTAHWQGVSHLITPGIQVRQGLSFCAVCVIWGLLLGLNLSLAYSEIEYTEGFFISPAGWEIKCWHMYARSLKLLIDDHLLQCTEHCLYQYRP